MNIIEPGYDILTPKDEIKSALNAIEHAGRTCYKSEEKIAEGTDIIFAEKLRDRKHEAMLEFGPCITVKFTANRGFTHEMVRHRLTSLAQESTRYCNYSKGKFGSEITTPQPEYIKTLNKDQLDWWLESMEIYEERYIHAVLPSEEGGLGMPAQVARDLLPIGVKADICVKANIREWRHIFRLRTSNAAHPIMRELMRPLCEELKSIIPIVFEDIKWNT